MDKITEYDRDRFDISRRITELVASTAGPWGGNVHFFSGDNPKMYRDGMRVLENWDPKGLKEHGVKALMLEAARRTVRAAGDGSTSTTILLHAIYKNALALIEVADTPVSRREVGRGIRDAAKWAAEEIDKTAWRLDIADPAAEKTLRDIATLAGGNDPEIGDAIVDALLAVGVDGDINSEFDARVEKVTVETRPGYKLPFGVIHNSMLPNGRASVLVQDAFCAFIAESLNTNEQLSFILKAWSAYCEANGAIQPLVIFCAGIDAEALNTMIHRTNNKGQKLPWYCVRVQATAEIWEDLEAITGALAPNGKQGRSVAYFTAKHSVVIPKVILSEKTAVIDIDPEKLEASGLTYRLAEKIKEVSEDDAAPLRSRFARLEGRTGTIKVPIKTMANRSWIAEVLEDAYLAAKSAVKHGYCPGAGKSLCALVPDVLLPQNSSQLIGAEAFTGSLIEVTVALLKNGGLPEDRAVSVSAQLTLDGTKTICLNSDTQATLAAGGNVPFVDAKEFGIIDSAEALKSAILFAAEEAADWIETPNVVIV